MSQQEIIHVHFYLHKLYAGDVVTDGPNGEKISIKADTMLLWVDLAPGPGDAHDARYVLVSASSVEVVRGSHRPLINGKKHFDETEELNRASLAGPFLLGQNAAAHVFPYPLTPLDRLTDGADGRALSVSGETLYLWIDSYKQSSMPHETRHVLISASDVRVEKGQWWPSINGRVVRFDHVYAAVPSPFVLRAR